MLAKLKKRQFIKYEEGEEKFEWFPIMTTEVVVNSLHPVYLRSYQFSSASFL